MNGMTPFKAYWNTKLIGLKGGHSMVTEMSPGGCVVKAG